MVRRIKLIGVAGKSGTQETLTFLISNKEGVWEEVAASRLDCLDCAVRHSCDLGGCFFNDKIVEGTKVKLYEKFISELL